jgi:hypothetical protein
VSDIVEEDVLEFLEKGTRAEIEIFDQLRIVLPQELVDALPRPGYPMLPEVDAYMDPPTWSGSADGPSPPEDLEDDGPAEMPTAESRSSAALLQLKDAVGDLQVRNTYLLSRPRVIIDALLTLTTPSVTGADDIERYTDYRSIPKGRPTEICRASLQVN